jgi:hypothetical protein
MFKKNGIFFYVFYLGTCTRERARKKGRWRACRDRRYPPFSPYTAITCIHNLPVPLLLFIYVYFAGGGGWKTKNASEGRYVVFPTPVF